MAEPAAGRDTGRRAGMIRTTFRHTCPRCGEGRLFESGYRIRSSCRSCGMDLLGSDGAHYGGPIALGYTIGGIAGIAVFWVLLTRFGFEPWVVWVSVASVVASILLTFRHCKAWWTWGLYRTGQIGGRRRTADRATARDGSGGGASSR